ncbi:MAG: glycosyltransferase family 2 protein, partial [Bacteroidaceae bacterium]|nr:glycosyltransferase family 2 protein [Bacteroidaceae bacterium]
MFQKMAKNNIETVAVGGLLQPTTCFKEIAGRAKADFLLLIGKDGVAVDDEQLDAMANAMPADAVMGYSHYRKKVDGNVTDAPTIDLQAGSLRNDFDFGPVVLFRVEALKRYLELRLDEYTYAGFYQLRLAMERIGKIYHHPEYVYTVDEDDTRKSGEKQFDYVNPAQRDVQIEMEQVCTAHLKAIDAWLMPCKYDRIDLSAGDFPVEASVVIPVLNRESTIADAITSVLKQKCSFAFNILVVDNHSTDRTPQIIDSFADERVVHIIPSRNDLGIGGCWNLAVNDARCGRFAVQLDSDDIYSDENTLQHIVDGFYEQQCAMLIGSYRICDFELNTLPPGVIDHAEWTEENGRNNALRINGLGAPRAFYTPVLREVKVPNTSYGEDYALGLNFSRKYQIGRVYD